MISRIALVWWVVCLVLTGSAAHAQDFTANLEVGGTYRMFTAGERVLLRLTVGGNVERHAVQVRVRAYDIFGRRLAPPQQYTLQPKANETTVQADLALPKSAITPAPGYYRVEAEFVSGGTRVLKATDLGVIPAPHPGLRPESFFASNTSSIRTGEELKFLRMIGMKIQRTHFSPRLAGPVPPVSTGAALSLNFTDQDRALAEAKAGDTWVLPIAGYAFEGTRSKLAEQTGMYGPPRDYAEFVNTWEQILRHYPESRPTSSGMNRGSSVGPGPPAARNTASCKRRGARWRCASIRDCESSPAIVRCSPKIISNPTRIRGAGCCRVRRTIRIPTASASRRCGPVTRAAPSTTARS